LERNSYFQLGIHPKKPNVGFNMTAFALRMSRYCNGASKRHIELLFNRYLDPHWLNDHDKPFVWELIEEMTDDEL